MVTTHRTGETNAETGKVNSLTLCSIWILLERKTVVSPPSFKNVTCDTICSFLNFNHIT